MPPYSQTPEGKRLYYAANRERINAARRQRYFEDQEYRDRVRDGITRQRRANPDVHRERDRRRSNASLVVRAKVRCVRCGYDRSPVALQWHHVDPSTKA